MDHIMPFRPMF